MDSKNPAIRREGCTRAHERCSNDRLSPICSPKFTIWPARAFRIKPTFKPCSIVATWRKTNERGECDGERSALGLVVGVGRDGETYGREETTSGSNGRGCIPAIFPLFVFHYFAEGSCPLLLRNTRGNDKGRSVAVHPVYNGKLCLPDSTNLFVQRRETRATETLPRCTRSRSPSLIR